MHIELSKFGTRLCDVTIANDIKSVVMAVLSQDDTVITFDFDGVKVMNGRFTYALFSDILWFGLRNRIRLLNSTKSLKRMIELAVDEKYGRLNYYREVLS